MVATPFRITPSLGPALAYASPVDGNYWDMVSPPSTVPSYQLGSKVVGNDGHDYVYVKAGGTIAASAQVALNESTWVATTGGSSGFYVPAAITGGVTEGMFFHVRKGTL